MQPELCFSRRTEARLEYELCAQMEVIQVFLAGFTKKFTSSGLLEETLLAECCNPQMDPSIDHHKLAIHWISLELKIHPS